MSDTARPDYDSPASLKRLLDLEGLAMSKRFGQNFLVSRNARERVLEELVKPNRAGAVPSGRVWEVGPGIGAMTAMVLDRGLALTAFEIDHGFARLLERSLGGHPGFRLVTGDFLDTWRAELASGGAPGSVLGNLPYNAAAAIIAALIEGLDGEASGLPARMVFTVQKEAGLRMAAKPDTEDYSAFSVLCTSACKVRIAFDLGSGSFWPAPNVTSSVVVLEPRRDPVLPGERKAFSAFVRAGFASRRKTLKNNLRATGRPEEEIVEAIAAAGAAPGVRAEALSPEELAAVFLGLRAARASREPRA